VCPVGTGWYLSGCDVCVKVVAGYHLDGDGPDYGDNVLATEAKIPHPKDVSVDDAGNIYIAGGGIHNKTGIQQKTAAASHAVHSVPIDSDVVPPAVHFQSC
jgi:hypothetical protein